MGKYPLPTEPPDIRSLFESFCEVLPAQDLSFLDGQLSAFKQRVSQAHKTPDRTSRLGEELYLRASLLLRLYTSFPKASQSLAVGAIRYLVRRTDGIDDDHPVRGLDDDVDVMNHVLERIGLADQFIRK
jgi:hypothetical protein